MRKAILQDINDIMKIITLVVREMRFYHNPQWDEFYPQEKDFLADIREGDLYISERDGRLVGFVCVNKIEPVEYVGLDWSSSRDVLVIHRMAVDPAYRRKGVASELMNFAEELALKNNIAYLKTDTNSINENMKALFLKCGYNYIGEISFLGKETPFYCYDKRLV